MIQDIRRWLVTKPLFISVSIVTGLILLTSITISFCVNAMKGEIYPLADWLFPSSLTPLLVTPVVASIFLRMIQRLEETGRQLAASMEREKLLALEMRHRIKNVFAVTSGLVTLAEREAGEDGEHRLARILKQKIAALARASDATFSPDLPSDGLQDSIELQGIVKAVMEPYGQKVEMEGAGLTVNAQGMTAVALILHELATNSVKHGALSSRSGSIRILWAREGDRLSLKWTEQDGPAIVAPPQHKGVGSTVINRFSRALGGSVAYDWQPSGLVVDISIPDGQ